MSSRLCHCQVTEEEAGQSWAMQLEAASSSTWKMAASNYSPMLCSLSESENQALSTWVRAVQQKPPD